METNQDRTAPGTTMEWGIFRKGGTSATPAEGLTYETREAAEKVRERSYAHPEGWEVRRRKNGPWELSDRESRERHPAQPIMSDEEYALVRKNLPPESTAFFDTLKDSGARLGDSVEGDRERSRYMHVWRRAVDSALDDGLSRRILISDLRRAHAAESRRG